MCNENCENVQKTELKPKHQSAKQKQTQLLECLQRSAFEKME